MVFLRCYVVISGNYYLLWKVARGRKLWNPVIKDHIYGGISKAGISQVFLPGEDAAEEANLLQLGEGRLPIVGEEHTVNFPPYLGQIVWHWRIKKYSISKSGATVHRYWLVISESNFVPNQWKFKQNKWRSSKSNSGRRDRVSINRLRWRGYHIPRGLFKRII